MIKELLKNWTPRALDIVMLGMPGLFIGKALGDLLNMMVFASVGSVPGWCDINSHEVGYSFALLSLYYLRHKVWNAPSTSNQSVAPEAHESQDS